MTNDEFLPENYKRPSTSKYMKFQAGDNKFRVLNRPVIGYVGWVKGEGKDVPVRKRMGEKMPAGARDVKHFWAMPVWNYNESCIQVLEITQATIQKSLGALIADLDWGSPLKYDVVINKEGEGLSTEYTVQPKPKKDLDKEIEVSFNDTPVNLDALFDGGDPFAIAEETRVIEDE